MTMVMDSYLVKLPKQCVQFWIMKALLELMTTMVMMLVTFCATGETETLVSFTAKKVNDPILI